MISIRVGIINTPIDLVPMVWVKRYIRVVWLFIISYIIPIIDPLNSYFRHVEYHIELLF